MDSCFGSWVIHTTLWRIVPRPPILCHFFVSFIFHIWQGQIWFGWHPKLVCTIFSRTGEYSYSRFFSVLTLPHGYATLRKGSCLEASLKTSIVELVKAKPKHLGAGRWDTMQHLLLLSGFYFLCWKIIICLYLLALLLGPSIAMGSTTCQGPNVTYTGTVSKTKSGRTCQNWNETTPQDHNDTSVGDHNFCRNPGNKKAGVWCYTTTTWMKWEKCDVPLCNETGKFNLVCHIRRKLS